MTVPKFHFITLESSPCDNYQPVTTFWPCPEVVIISDKHCIELGIMTLRVMTQVGVIKWRLESRSQELRNKWLVSSLSVVPFSEPVNDSTHNSSSLFFYCFRTRSGRSDDYLALLFLSGPSRISRLHCFALVAHTWNFSRRARWSAVIPGVAIIPRSTKLNLFQT